MKCRYSSLIVSTTVWDYQCQCGSIYNTHSGAIMMWVKTSLSHWGGVTVNTVPNMRSCTETANSLRNPVVRRSQSFVLYSWFLSACHGFASVAVRSLQLTHHRFSSEIVFFTVCKGFSKLVGLPVCFKPMVFLLFIYNMRKPYMYMKIVLKLLSQDQVCKASESRQNVFEI